MKHVTAQFPNFVNGKQLKVIPAKIPKLNRIAPLREPMFSKYDNCFIVKQKNGVSYHKYYTFNTCHKSGSFLQKNNTTVFCLLFWRMNLSHLDLFAKAVKSLDLIPGKTPSLLHHPKNSKTTPCRSLSSLNLIIFVLNVVY